MGMHQTTVGDSSTTIFHNRNMEVSGRLLDQENAQIPGGQSKSRIEVESIKNNYYTAWAKEYGGNYGKEHGSDGGDSPNKDRRRQRRKQHIEQSRYLRRNNTARREQ
jgi:hypothetical protein